MVARQPPNRARRLGTSPGDGLMIHGWPNGTRKNDEQYLLRDCATQLV